MVTAIVLMNVDRIQIKNVAQNWWTCPRSLKFFRLLADMI